MIGDHFEISKSCRRVCFTTPQKEAGRAAIAAGASVKVVAPKIGGDQFVDCSRLLAHGQLAGTPSKVFDAVAVVLSEAGDAALAKDGAAINFVRDAFGLLKAIAIDAGGRSLRMTFLTSSTLQ